MSRPPWDKPDSAQLSDNYAVGDAETIALDAFNAAGAAGVALMPPTKYTRNALYGCCIWGLAFALARFMHIARTELTEVGAPPEIFGNAFNKVMDMLADVTFKDKPKDTMQ